MAFVSLILIGLLALASLAVWSVVGLRWSRGRSALDPLPRNPSPFLPVACIAAAVYVALMLALKASLLLTEPQPFPDVDLTRIQSSVLEGILELAVGLLLVTGAGRVALNECGLSWHPLGRQLVDGVNGFLASFLPVCLMLVLTYSLRTLENQHPFLKFLQEDQRTEAVAWLLLSAVVLAPLREELLFRVMLQDGLSRRLGPVPAIGIASIAFCLVHGFPDSIALLPLAIILGYVYERRQSFLSIVVIHALFNLTNIGILLFEADTPPPGS